MSRWLAIALFSTLALSVLAGGHFYLVTRLVLELDLAPPVRSSLVVAICALAALLVLVPIAERTLSRRAAGWIAWPASLWMGFAFLLLVAVAGTDLLLWVVGSAASAADVDAPATAATARGRALAVAGVTAVMGAFGLRSALQPPRVRRVEVALARWPRALDGLRIAQICDIHIGALLGAKFARAVTDRVNALEADLVCVTGDLVDGPVSSLREEVAPFADLRGRLGAFFVTGNHDYFSGADSWVERMGELGLRVLRNERITVEDGEGAAFDLAGVDDHRASFVTGGAGEDLEAALAGRDPDRCLVLMAHDPTTFKRASGMGVDLQLSGHTHGGQIWPFVYLVRLAVPWVAGLYSVGAAQLWVSRGTGFWGPPMRVRAPAEITELVLRTAA